MSAAVSADRTVEILDDAEGVARRAADWLVETLLAGSGPAAVALSGGSTPRRLYQLLATSPWRERMPWPRIDWFWGDERFVPATHPDSNYRMADEALLSHVPVAPERVHPVPTAGLEPEQAAAAYEEALREFYGETALDPARPLFAATLLGLGGDGHTASLLPGTSVLEETRRWAAAVMEARPFRRITLTYPALNSSRELAFLVTGAAKRPVLQRLFAGGSGLPAERIRPVGRLRFFLDRAAA